MNFTDYTFLVIAIGTAILGAVCGMLGSFAVLRKQSLLGDAISHAALPGIAIAFLITGAKESNVLLLGVLDSWYYHQNTFKVRYSSRINFVAFFWVWNVTFNVYSEATQRQSGRIR